MQPEAKPRRTRTRKQHVSLIVIYKIGYETMLIKYGHGTLEGCVNTCWVGTAPAVRGLHHSIQFPININTHCSFAENRNNESRTQRKFCKVIKVIINIGFGGTTTATALVVCYVTIVPDMDRKRSHCEAPQTSAAVSNNTVLLFCPFCFTKVAFL